MFFRKMVQNTNLIFRLLKTPKNYNLIEVEIRIKCVYLTKAYHEHFFVVKNIVARFCFIIKVHNKRQVSQVAKIISKTDNVFMFKFIDNTGNVRS